MLVVFRCSCGRKFEKIPIKTFLRIVDLTDRELFYFAVRFSSKEWWQSGELIKEGVLTPGGSVEFYHTFGVLIQALEGGTGGKIRAIVWYGKGSIQWENGVYEETITLDQLYDALIKQLPGDSFKRHLRRSLCKHLHA